MDRRTVAFPILGAIAAILVLAPSSRADFPRALVSLAIVVTVGVISYLYVRFATRATRARVATLRERFPIVATVKTDADSIELAAHIAGVDAPSGGVYALAADSTGIRLFRSPDDELMLVPWSDIRSVDLNPSSLGQKANRTISVFTTVSPRIAIDLVAQSRYGILRPSLDEVGAVIAALREQQAAAA